MKLTAGTIRVYFNHKEDAPKVWSIDLGAGAGWEMLVSRVAFRDIVGVTVFDAAAVSQPKAWLLFSNVALTIDFYGNAEISPIYPDAA